jgi:single-strand DNA-binding protein
MNTVCIIGRLTRDPEQRVTTGGTEITQFSIAHDGRKDEVSYFDCKCFGKTAELVAQYKRKGDQVGVSGHLVQERWEKDGAKRSAVRIIAEQVTFLGARSEQSDPKPFAAADADAGFESDDDIPF